MPDGKMNKKVVVLSVILLLLTGVLIAQHLRQQQRIEEAETKLEERLINIEDRIISMEGAVESIEEVALQDTIRLSVSDRNWYPFTFPEGDEITGMHVDMVTQALENLGYNVELESYPTMRAISQAQEGQTDGAISVAYDEGLENLAFPTDVAGEEDVESRIMQVDQVLVTHADDDYSFGGDLSTIPEPARLIHGEEHIAGRLQDLGVEISRARSAETNFSQLIRDEGGSVITTTIMAEDFHLDPEYADDIHIHAQPLTSLPYHLAFSEAADLSEDDKEEIWEEIASLREDYLYMIPLFVEYD